VDASRIPGTRELVVVDTPFIVPYRIRQNDIEVITVLHAARQCPDCF
jgi:toxin ParE1/3/4